MAESVSFTPNGIDVNKWKRENMTRNSSITMREHADVTSTKCKKVVSGYTRDLWLPITGHK